VSAGSVRSFLERHALAARRDLGQNFLIDETAAARLVELAGVEAADTVVEIGTGLGILTAALAARAARVVTLEIDAGLVRALRQEQRLPPSVELIHTDALRADLAALVGAATPPVRVVANLPYSVSAPLLRRLLDLREALVDWSVMVQREVAERLLAGPGSRDYGSLGVLHALVARARRLRELAPGSFHPAPKVRSSFLRITPMRERTLTSDEFVWVERVVRAAFSKRRKTLFNALRSSDLGLPESGIEGALARAGVASGVRAERVAPEGFLELARALRANPGEDSCSPPRS
jgi:16S rRNA (adenine1518-N6/adenine1519-N6)-dimethyltransferase